MLVHAEVGQIAGIAARVDRTAAFEEDLRHLMGCRCCTSPEHAVRPTPSIWSQRCPYLLPMHTHMQFRRVTRGLESLSTSSVCMGFPHRAGWAAEVSPPSAPVQAYQDELGQVAAEEPLLVQRPTTPIFLKLV